MTYRLNKTVNPCKRRHICTPLAVAGATLLLAAATAGAAHSRPTPNTPSKTLGSPATEHLQLLWMDNLEVALTLATVEYRPVLVLFSSPDCPWCLRMKTQVLPDPELAELLGNFVLVEIDVSENRGLAAQYEVRGVPALLVLTGDGRAQHGISGYADSAQLRQLLEGVLNPELVRQAQTGDTDILKKVVDGNLSPEDWPDVMAALGRDAIRDEIRTRLLKLSPFPAAQVLGMLSHPRLAVRVGALDLLEELAGTTYNFDPWIGPGALDAQSTPMAQWTQWAAGVTGRVETVYASLDGDRIAALVQDLISENREHSIRAMRMLEQGGEGVARALADTLDQTPDLTYGARSRIREVQYALYLPSTSPLPPAETAHRLVFGNPDVRMKTLTSLTVLGADALPILREFLSDLDPMIRETTVDAMIAAGGRRALAILGKHLQTETNRHVQHAVLRNLANVKSRGAMLLLAPYLSHADENLAIAALNSIARMETIEPAEAVAACFGDPRWRVRAAAIETAGTLKMKTLSDRTVSMLNDPDDYVRFAAVGALAKLGAKQSVGTLKTLFLKDDTLKGPIISAFGGMELAIPPEFITAVPGMSSEALLAVVQGLGDCEERGLPMAAKLAENENNDVACAALRILGQSISSHEAYMPLVVQALTSGKRQKQMAVLESAYNRYFDSDEIIDVGFEDDTVPATALPPSAIPAEPGAQPASQPPSAIDDLFAAFTEPGSTNASPPPPAPGMPAAAKPTAVDDVFAAFGNAPATEAAPQTSPVDDVFAAFEAAAPTNTPAALTPASGPLVNPLTAMLGALVNAFSISPTETAPRSTKPTSAAAWKEFNNAAAGCLTSPDNDVRFSAAVLLGSHGDLRAIPVLTESTTNRVVAQRVEIAQSLGRSRSREGFATLTALLEDPSPEVRATAVTVLSSSVSGIDRIFEALLRDHARLTAEDVLQNRASNLERNPNLKQKLSTHARSMLSPEQTPERQTLGLILLAELGSAQDENQILPFLDADSPHLRRAAWYAFGRITPRKFEGKIDALVKDSSDLVRIVLPAIFTQDTPWVHYLNAETPLRGNRYYGGMMSYGSSRSSMAAPVRDALRTLSQDSSPGVRFESLFCLMSNRQYIDLSELVRAAEAFPDRKAVANRITSFMVSHDDELGSAFKVLLKYLDDSYYSEGSLDRVRKRLGAGEESDGDATLRELLMRPRTAAVSQAPLFVQPDAVTAVPITEIRIVYFSTFGCRECERAEHMLKQLAEDIPELKIDKHEIHTPDAMRLNQILCSRFNTAGTLYGVTPALFTGAGALIRDDFSLDRIGELIARSVDVPLAEWYTVSSEDEVEADTAIEQRFKSVNIFLLLAYALGDSVNPCAFAAIIFFISYLQVTRRTPWQIAQVALTFITGIFLTYLALGFGLGELISRMTALRRAGIAMNWLMGFLTLVLALVSLRDAWLCHRGRMKDMALQLPAFLKSRIHSVIRQNARQSGFVAAAFVTGVVISVLELACTGQAYLPAIHYMLRTGDSVRDAAGYLVIYNIAFVAPLFIIFGLAYGGMRSETFILWLQRHGALVKLIGAILFFALFLIILRSQILPDLHTLIV